MPCAKHTFTGVQDSYL